MSDLSEFYDEDMLTRDDDGEIEYGDDDCFPCEDSDDENNDEEGD